MSKPRTRYRQMGNNESSRSFKVDAFLGPHGFSRVWMGDRHEANNGIQAGLFLLKAASFSFSAFLMAGHSSRVTLYMTVSLTEPSRRLAWPRNTPSFFAPNR